MDIYKVKGIIWKRGGRNSYDLEEAVNCCGIVSNRYDIAVALELSAAVYQQKTCKGLGLSAFCHGEGRGPQGPIHH